MPRALRIQDAGYIHHVVCRGNDRQVIFKTPKDFQEYLRLLEEARRNYPLNVYNYVLMDNHVHLLVEPTSDGSLSKVMETVSKAYAKYFNKIYGRVGHVFQGRFKSFLVQQERYFFACSRYVDMNPVKAQIVADPKDYPWSGHNVLAYGGNAAISINLHSLYNSLGVTPHERQISYRVLVKSYQGEDLDLLDRRAGVLGDKEFKSRLKL